MKKIILLIISATLLNACTTYFIHSQGSDKTYKTELVFRGQTEEVSKTVCSPTWGVILGDNILMSIFTPIGAVLTLGLSRSKSLSTVCPSSGTTTPIKQNNVL